MNYSELDEKDSGRKNEHFIEAVFELDDPEIDSIESTYMNSLSEGNAGDSEEDDVGDESSESKANPFGITKQLLIKKDYAERFYVYLLSDKGEPKSDGIENSIGEAAFDKICELIPKFVYYSEYGNLDSDLYLPHVNDSLSRIDSLTGKERMKARNAQDTVWPFKTQS